MGLGKALKKVGRIGIAPVKNIAKSTKSLVKGDIKGALKYGTRAALAPISQPAQLLRGAPVLGGLMNKLPGAGRLDAGLNNIFGNPNAGRKVPPAAAAFNAFAAGPAPEASGPWGGDNVETAQGVAPMIAPTRPMGVTQGAGQAAFGAPQPPPPMGVQQGLATPWGPKPAAPPMGVPQGAGLTAPGPPAFDPLNPQGITNFAPGAVGRGRRPRNAGGFGGFGF